jgi:hypothetical protein
VTESETANIIAEALDELGTDVQDNEFSAGFIADRLYSAAKLEAYEFGLTLGSVLVMLDPRVTGVDVPPQHRNGPTLTLRFGVNLNPPILGLEADRDGVRGTLSFGGVKYYCEVPWHSVFAMKSDEGDWYGVWHESIPEDKEVVAMTAKNVAPPATARAHLRLVPESNDEESAPE